MLFPVREILPVAVGDRSAHGRNVDVLDLLRDRPVLETRRLDGRKPRSPPDPEGEKTKKRAEEKTDAAVEQPHYGATVGAPACPLLTATCELVDGVGEACDTNVVVVAAAAGCGAVITRSARLASPGLARR